MKTYFTMTISNICLCNKVVKMDHKKQFHIEYIRGMEWNPSPFIGDSISCCFPQKMFFEKSMRSLYDHEKCIAFFR